MLCIHCENQTDSEERCESCGESPLVAGEYRVLEVLGRGANATTYRAERIEDGEVVALKELLVRNADSLKTLELFEREARTLEQLEHRGIPTYHDDLTVELGPNVGMYIAQEFVDGTSLAETMREGPMEPVRVLRIVRGVAEVLDYLDDLNPPVIHRDIKPANIIDRGGQRVALLDFGSVRDIAGDARNGVPTMAGTVGYMAPEQLLGQSSPASDVYGLAVTAVTLFTGEPPSESIHDSDWAWSEELPDEVRQLLKRMLATRSANRPSARELRDEIDDVLEAFERRREVQRRRETALARVPDVPRAIPGNFEHRFAEERLAFLSGGATAFLALLFVVAGMANLVSGVLIFGSILTAIPLYKSREEKKRVRLFTHGEAVIGVVDGVVSDEVSMPMLHYSFRVDGEIFRDTWSSTTQFIMKAGEDLLVFYDPENPRHNRPLPEFLTNAPQLM
jgi:serine/threonine protein kinase